MTTMRQKGIEPYKLLFPCGVMAGFLGLVLWIVFEVGQLPFYPRQSHANVMYFGFLWSFVAGFLMTAVPKMTGTQLATKYEMFLAMALVGAQIVVNFFNQVPVAVTVLFVQSIFLFVFVARRFLKKRVLPFEGFLFIPFAFFQVFLAIALFFTYQKFSMNTFYLLAGEAFILNLVIGLGTRLIPVLSRIPDALAPDRKSNSNNFVSMIVLAILLNLGFVLQTFANETLGIGLRLLVVGFIAFKYFRIAESVPTKSFVGFGLRCGVLFILASYALLLFLPVQSIAIQHLAYIGGFVLITFMVGTRVMLAHGGQSLDYETQSGRIGGVALLFALTSLLRLFAGSDVYSLVMKLGIIAFIFSSLLWFHKFIKILKGAK